MYMFLGTTEILMYDVLNTVAMFCVIFFNIFNWKKNSVISGSFYKYILSRYNKRDNRLINSKLFFLVTEAIIVSVIQYLPVAFLNFSFGNIFNTGPNYFGLLLFIPIFLFLGFYFFGLHPLKTTDLITPAYPLALIFVKLGCFFNGCCYGFECEFGFFNQYSDRVDFPIQLVETLLALLIFILLLIIRKKVKPGTLLPLYIIIYSSTRFFSEFFRDAENVLGPLKLYQILCIVGIIVGITEYLLITKYSEKIVRVFDSLPVPAIILFKKLVPEKNIIHHKKKRKK